MYLTHNYIQNGLYDMDSDFGGHPKYIFFHFGCNNILFYFFFGSSSCDFRDAQYFFIIH